jgi:phosphoribosylformylglycinamidine synthase II
VPKRVNESHCTAGGIRENASVLGLTFAEFDEIVKRIGREPNSLEAALFGAMWSEHCGYKHSRPLLNSLPTEGAGVLMGPGENAGVVDLGEGYALAFKVESHNHPSAIEPFQGAATGVGGILRDIFAMGARPVAILNSLHFGPLGSGRTRNLLSGVVEGIAHYGNAIGVPTVGGQIIFHPSYAENPLVNVMALGLMRHEDLRTGTAGTEGSLLIYVGSKTGRDGLGGAVFASGDLSTSSDSDRPAVQIGDPFMEKLLLEACLEAVERGLVIGVQDMGAAGLTSSIAEMADRAGCGVDVDIDAVPCREKGMTPAEVLLSESQERMILAVDPGVEKELLLLLAKWDLDAVRIGKVRSHGKVRVLKQGYVVADVPAVDLANAPTYRPLARESEEIISLRNVVVVAPALGNAASTLETMLALPTIASKASVYEQYDHQVMTNTVVLPGQGDAAVLRIKDSVLGFAATLDCNPRFVYLDPREGTKLAVAEASRNLVCVGARPLAVTNNLNFGNPTVPEVYYQLSESVIGLAEACRELGTPVTGGNVSLFNQFRSGDDDVAIYPTPTIGMVGVLENVESRATMNLKREGDHIFLLGPPQATLAGSLYLSEVVGLEAGTPPVVDFELERRVESLTLELIRSGLVDTAHDCSDGGLAVTLAEMCIGGRLGAKILLPDGVPVDGALFGEAPSRIVVGVSPNAVSGANRLIADADVPSIDLGQVGGDKLDILWDGGELRISIERLASAYEQPIREALE